MTQKDITEKTLFDHPDVMADILNCLLFSGRKIVFPDNLRPAGVRSQYKADGKIHEQKRDLANYLTDGVLIKALIGTENETAPEKFMPVRHIGYDGQSYRKQLLKKNVSRIYPVITIVLYFGLTHWNYSRHLIDLLDIPENFRPFVSDYEMKNLYEISFLTARQVTLFHSDFRYIADYFVQMQRTDNYIPSPDEIDHPDELLKRMSILTGDSRFEKSIPDLKRKEER